MLCTKWSVPIDRLNKTILCLKAVLYITAVWVTPVVQFPALSVIAIVITVAVVATVPSLMNARHLLPCWVLVETSTEGPAQTPMLLLGDIVFTLRFGNSLGMCGRLWFLSNGSKWKVPKAKSLPTESLECYDAMQISTNLRRTKEKKMKTIKRKHS